MLTFLDPKAKKCIFLGYGDHVKGYRLFDESRSRVLHSRDVQFDEFGQGMSDQNDGPGFAKPVMKKELHVPKEKHESEDAAEQEEEDSTGDDDVTEDEDVAEEPVAGEPELRRSQRERRKPNYYGEWVNTAKSEPREPETMQDVLQSPDKSKWMEAMEKEMSSLHDNDVWDLVELPKDRKAVGSKWVFKQKTDAEGSVVRHKARLVAQGYSQKFGLDYDETFCPVVRFESIRTVIALAAQHELQLQQMDVTTAFLNGELQEEVYMKQPEGFAAQGKEKLVCKLRRSIYGLKQSPRCWNTVLNRKLKEMGFAQTAGDPCIYTCL